MIYVPEDCLTLTNGAATDEIPRHVAFHLGIHCLPKYSLRGLQYTKD